MTNCFHFVVTRLERPRLRPSMLYASYIVNAYGSASIPTRRSNADPPDCCCCLRFVTAFGVLRLSSVFSPPNRLFIPFTARNSGWLVAWICLVQDVSVVPLYSNGSSRAQRCCPTGESLILLENKIRDSQTRSYVTRRKVSLEHLRTLESARCSDNFLPPP